MNDTTLKQAVHFLQRDIARLARRYKYTAYSFWNYLEYHEEEPRETESWVSVLTCDEGMLAAFNGYGDIDFESEFGEVLDKAGFSYEIHSVGVIHIYSKDDEKCKQYQELLQWQWITHLIQPEFTSLYDELFAYFQLNPEKFYSLRPRQLEFYIGEIFRNQGYDVEMGPGTNDGGIDLRLYRKEEIDQITTLVQVKRYKKSLPIRLDAVAALYGHIEAERAQEGLFVTTSRYLPSTRNFANRLSKKISLSDTNDLISWSDKVKTTINNNKTKLVSDAQLLQLVEEVNAKKLKNVILIHSIHSGVVNCEYGLILKETRFAALIIMLPKRTIQVFDAPHNTRGMQVPLLDNHILKKKTDEHLFRVTVDYSKDGAKTYRGRDRYFTIWNGEPNYFDWND